MEMLEAGESLLEIFLMIKYSSTGDEDYLTSWEEHHDESHDVDEGTTCFSPFSGKSHIEALFQQYAYSEYAKMIKELVYNTAELITEIFVRKNSRTGWWICSFFHGKELPNWKCPEWGHIEYSYLASVIDDWFWSCPSSFFVSLNIQDTPVNQRTVLILCFKDLMH